MDAIFPHYRHCIGIACTANQTLQMYSQIISLIVQCTFSTASHTSHRSLHCWSSPGRAQEHP